MKIFLVCSECGGNNIKTKAWVDANTNEFADDVGCDEKYCEDCDSEVKFILVVANDLNP